MEDWERLGRLVKERRESLGLKQSDLDGVSSSSLHKIENALAESYQSIKLRALENALGWAPGAVDLILAGADGVETLVQVKAPAVTASSSDGELAAALATLAEEVRLLRAELLEELRHQS